MPSNLIPFLKSRSFFRSIIILLIVTISIFFIVTAILNSYTHHGENISVPELRGLKISKLDSILKTHSFHYKIVDSLYDGEKESGIILDQDPPPKSKVKENRTIYLTINATQPPDVKMPDLVDVSFRQAEAMLQSFGLITGDIIYRSDLAKNAVLGQLYKNKNIKPGTMIPKGAVIDLILGDGLENVEVNVPDLIGLTLDDASGLLRKASLTISNIHFDTDVSDSLVARIYMTKPSANNGITLKHGEGIEVFLR